MSDSVASFPEVPEVEQKLPIVPLASLTSSVSVSSTGFNLRMLGVGSDGLVSVTGNTRPFINNFKTLGGHWQKEQSAWKFESKHEGEVRTLVDAINSGKVQPEKFTPYKNKFKKTLENSIFATTSTQSSSTSSVSSMLPSTGPSLDYQLITYTSVFVPRVGMTVEISVRDLKEEFPVVKVGKTGSNVDHALITAKDGKVSELVVMKGHWVVNGMLQEHRVFFKSNK